MAKKKSYNFIYIFPIIGTILVIVLMSIFFNMFNNYNINADIVDTFNWENIVSFVGNNEKALVLLILSITFFFTFVILPFIIALIISRIPKRKQKKIDEAYANGGQIVLAEIISMEQTGIYLNYQPQVLMTLKFYFKGRELTKEYKTIVDLVNIPRVGEEIRLIYDPVKDKLLEPN